MSATSPGAQAVAALDIEDVFLVSTKSTVTRDLNPSERKGAEIHAMQRVRIDDQVHFQTRAPEEFPDQSFTVVRYFVTFDVLIAKDTIKPDDGELKAEDQKASFEFVFAADYRCKDEKPSPESLGAFAKNVIFHVWPYCREAVHTECARMRIHPLTIPMLKPGQKFPGIPVAAKRELSES